MSQHLGVLNVPEALAQEVPESQEVGQGLSHKMSDLSLLKQETPLVPAYKTSPKGLV